MSPAAPLRAWNRFWFGPVSARPLGVFRVAFGLIVLMHLALLMPEADEWLSDAGRLRGGEAAELATPLRPSPLQHFQAPAVVRGWLVASTAVAAMFTLGWRTRINGVLLYGLLLGIHHRNLLTVSGADVLLMIVAFLLMLSPCGAAFSLDARRRARRLGVPAEPLILPWAQRLIQLQLALVYFSTAMIKAKGAAWADGTALHYVLHNAEFRRYGLGLTAYPALINLLTYGALLLEFALPLLIWFRAARAWVCLAGVGLHLGIVLTVNIPVFGELMAACYLLFLTPAELDGLLRRVDPRNLLRRPRPSARVPGRVDRGGAELPSGQVRGRSAAGSRRES